MTDEVVDVVGGLRVKHLLHRGLLAVALGLHLLLGLDLDLDGSVDLGLSSAFRLLNLERVALREQPLLNLDELLGLTRACTCRTGDPECARRRRRTSWSSSCTAPGHPRRRVVLGDNGDGVPAVARALGRAPSRGALAQGSGCRGLRCQRLVHAEARAHDVFVCLWWCLSV